MYVKKNLNILFIACKNACFCFRNSLKNFWIVNISKRTFFDEAAEPPHQVNNIDFHYG